MILERFAVAGKVAIVTGAGKGIGRGIALCLADAGADVSCVDMTVAQVEETVQSIERMGRKALPLACDVRESEQVEHMVQRTRQEFDRIDILVNNVGGAMFRPTLQMSARAWERVLRENLVSTFLCCQAVAPIMLEQKCGSIVNISTRDSILPSVNMAAYAAAKAGVNSLTRTLAWELAPHIRVNAVLPGLVLTESSDQALGPVKDKITAGTPLKRMGTPEDIGLAVLFLASSASDWITGRLFEVDGGIEFVPLF